MATTGVVVTVQVSREYGWDYFGSDQESHRLRTNITVREPHDVDYHKP
ncbi:uncharacterized protein ANIA_11512 [Aspergillus nidulans FGSC A4]|uniref:Uncharacterized protein n=1 Tax=Emericella nidulans (strain FGSC A4 / ATCC 38163 / CBS 112.46 / NRRL 194 / M139) TaxID=227321 RepID=C8V069_EMENI|nr:hypothetical protein [Aspergillus nidulans FGSC A4]CBF69418.1 TPA: hypothetical protein ANIA_11512 [Aspergillus nidulans FGSC A4]